MGRHQLRGTPSLVVIDRAGRLRVNAFRRIDDLTVGATLTRQIDEPRSQPQALPAARLTPWAVSLGNRTPACALGTRNNDG